MRLHQTLPAFAPAALVAALFVPAAAAQPGRDGPPGRGPGGPPMGEVRKVMAKFDKDKNGRLDAAERKAAREELERDGGRGGFGRGPGRGGNRGTPKQGEPLNPTNVKTYPKAGLYDGSVLRTLFLEFENNDWEAELAAFYHTDIEVPATLTVDGKKYPNVGVRFRGMSSYFTVGQGWKRSMNVKMDFVDKKQHLYGFRTLNLLNSHDDSSFLRGVLYSDLARQSIPTPRTNLVRVAINGESWGVYVNQEQFNKDFLAEQFGKKKGDRWKVQGSPGGRGGLEYLGKNVEEYRRRYKLKSDESEEAWKALINLCQVLNTTPADKLEEALKPILDIDGTLWFLALDCALINMDGYWVRSSDYAIYRDPRGKFHMVPHDMNEGFVPAGGGPGGGRPGGGFRPGLFFARPLLEARDSDKDGKLSKAESLAAVKALYKLCEADRTGAVGVESLEKALDKLFPRNEGGGRFGPASPAAALARSVIEKAGKDGKVTEAALLAEAEKLFAKVDKNKDGKLEGDELGEGLNELFPARGPGGPGGRGPGGPGGPGGRGPGGPVGFGGPGGRGQGLQLDPLVGLNDATKPLRSKLLAVPALRERYLKYVKTIAEDRLDWKKLGPQVAAYRKLIEADIKADTKKLSSLEAFEKETSDQAPRPGATPGRGASIREFAEGRRKFLLENPEIKKLK